MPVGGGVEVGVKINTKIEVSAGAAGGAGVGAGRAPPPPPQPASDSAAMLSKADKGRPDIRRIFSGRFAWAIAIPLTFVIPAKAGISPSDFDASLRFRPSPG